MKTKILSILFLVLILLPNLSKAQTQYFNPTVVNTTSCNITVSFLDAGLNVLYSASFPPGTTPVGCQVGPCVWVSSDATGSCPITISAVSGSIFNNYVAVCGVCCTPVCFPLGTIEIPAAFYNNYTWPAGSCPVIPGDTEEEFRVSLY